MTTREEAKRVLRTLATRSGDRMALGEAALALAALGRPRVSLARYRRHLQTIADDVTAYLKATGSGPPTIDDCIAALNTVLFDQHGYQGDAHTYDDLQNANLMRVIDRKKGLPVSLGILYLHAGRAQGWDMVGLGFPGHFLISLQYLDERAILDPFNRGSVMGAAELRSLMKATAGADAELSPHLYSPVSDQEILLRLQNNIKLRLIQSGDIEHAIEAIETMMMLAPDQADLWREAGILHARIGNIRAAVTTLEQFIEISGTDAARYQVAALVQELRAKLN